MLDSFLSVSSETRSKICELATLASFIMSGGTKLFVYGVNRSCPKDLLEDKFAKIGAVSDVYITEKGYAFVTMADEGDAQAAVDELNGTRYSRLFLRTLIDQKTCPILSGVLTIMWNTKIEK